MRWISVVAGVLVVALAGEGTAQSQGSRPPTGGGGAAPPSGLDHFAAEHYITIRGSAEVRAVPTGIRVVFAVASEAESAKACQERNGLRVEAFLQALEAQGVVRERIVVDFIALVPVHDWIVEERGGKQVAVEQRVGFRLQHNVHVAVVDEPAAQAAVVAALTLDITDVLAFDYWCDGLDALKVRAQEQALVEAKRKSNLLLGAAFDQAPLPINVHETTTVLYPKDLYQSFQSAYAGEFQIPYRGQLPMVSAFRPRNTYYHGQLGYVDVQPSHPPMRPEISVVSEVSLYYAAPDRPPSAPSQEGLQRR